MRRIAIRLALTTAACGIVAVCCWYPVFFCLAMTVRYAIEYTFDKGRWSYSSNAEVLESADNRSITVVERPTGKVLGRFPGKYGVAAYCPTANTLAVTNFGGSEDGTKVLNVDSGEVLMAVDHGGGPMALSPDGRMLASAGPLGGDVRLWDTSTGQERVCEDHDDWQGCWGGWSDFCHYLTFSPDGRTLAACNDGRIAYWDVASGKNIWITHPTAVLVCFTLLSLTVFGVGLAAMPWLRSWNLTRVFAGAFLLLQALEIIAHFTITAHDMQTYHVLAAGLMFFLFCFLGLALLWLSGCATRQAGLGVAT